MAGELLMSISKDERERAIFRNRRIAKADQESNMAQALLNAQTEEREKWQSVVNKQAAEIARLRAMLDEKQIKLREENEHGHRL